VDDCLVRVVSDKNRPGKEIVRSHLGEERVMHILVRVLYRNPLALDPTQIFRPVVSRAGRKRHRMDDLVSNFTETLEILEQLSGQSVSRADHFGQ
jgi:hypothetical protein